MKTLFIIREPGRLLRYNYALCYKQHNILSSHKQGFSRRLDCLKSANKNVIGAWVLGKNAVEITRAAFNKKFN